MSKNDKIYDTARVAFQKLTIEAGDVVCVHLPEDIAHEQMHALADVLAPLATEHECSVIFLTQGITLDRVPEHRMNEFGWFKFDPEKMN